MKPQEWLLAYLALPLDASNTEKSIDPVRIMKGMFLFAMEGTVADEGKYNFDAYSYGPCSFEIYSDLDNLLERGIIPREFRAGETWPRYSVMSKGVSAFEELKKVADVAGMKQLSQIKNLVLSMSFLSLLKYVYNKYPKYATKSLISIPQDYK